MNTGRCLCGAVTYTVAGAIRDIVVCHCRECLRWSGGPWAATAADRASISIAGDVRWIASPASVSQADRGSCATCGSALFWSAPGRRTISFAAGTLEDSSTLRVAAHIWTREAPPWTALDGDAIRYPVGYPKDGPALSWR